MARFDHGGDIYAHEGVVDFSANINPLGMPAAAQRAIVEHVGDFEAYPDVECRALRRALARSEGIGERNIVCTAGASDLFQRLCETLRPQAALVTAPCFSGYEEVLERVGCLILRHELFERESFDVTESLLGFSQPAGRQTDAAQVAGSWLGSTGPVGLQRAGVVGDPVPDMLFLCNPNNPTGRTVGRDLLVRVLDEARAAGIVIVLDECFLDFTSEQSAVDLCMSYPNLVVARAFTKMFAMAGLRIGYGICADEDLIARLARAGQPWAVSVPAQLAATAALGEEGWVERTRSYVDEQRVVLAAGLEACGLRVVPGEANYLLFRSSRELYGPLLERGFLIRRCGNFQGLDERWYRVAVRTAEENAAFLKALREVCS